MSVFYSVFLFTINLQDVTVVIFLITAALLHKFLHSWGHILTFAELRGNKRDILDFVEYL